MKESKIESKYAVGQLVCANKAPHQKLIIRRYYHRIYYCRTLEGEEKEYAFFEKEIAPAD